MRRAIDLSPIALPAIAINMQLSRDNAGPLSGTALRDPSHLPFAR
jgi:hypothetical protein